MANLQAFTIHAFAWHEAPHPIFAKLLGRDHFRNHRHQPAPQPRHSRIAVGVGRGDHVPGGNLAFAGVHTKGRICPGLYAPDRRHRHTGKYLRPCRHNDPMHTSKQFSRMYTTNIITPDAATIFITINMGGKTGLVIDDRHNTGDF